MDVVQYKCPNCAANIEYNAQKQCFHCEYCMSDFSKEDIQADFKRNEEMKLDEEAQRKAEEFENGTNLYSCPNCGAEIITESTTSATFCYYCHNPVILSGRLSGDYRPSKVIPFAVDKDAALDKFKKWVQKKWFVPNDFKSKQQLEKMTGLYVPFWVADCNVDATMTALGKKHRSWSSGSYTYTETKEYEVIRRAFIDFDGLPNDGSLKIDDELVQAIEPFNYQKAEDFSMSYLSGFLADKYDVDKVAVFPKIRERASAGCKSLLRNSMTGYSSVTVQNENYNILHTSWQYILMPIWFMTFKYQDKIYSFAINGQTGKLAGIPPLCKAKLRAFAAAFAVGITAIAALIGWCMG